MRALSTLLLAAALLTSGPILAGGPRQLSFTGNLESGGAPVNGTRDLRFFLVTSPTGQEADALWTETHTAVEVTGGRFSVRLGSVTPLPPALFSRTDLYVGIVVDGTPLQGRQKLLSAPFAVQAVDGVPIGAVIDWWRPDNTFPIPDGYQLCDGSMINDPLSPYNGTNVPDLIGRFTRGAGAEGSAAGVIERSTGGGSDVTVSATTSSNGAHQHRWARYMSGAIWRTWNASNGEFALVDWGNGISGDGGGEYPLQSGIGAVDTYTQSNGAHTHSISTTVNAANLVPAYVGMLKIMRIR